MLEGRPFSWLPTPDREFTEEEQQLLRLRMAELDRIAERIGPEECACFQAEVERKRAANLRAIEREQAEREAQEAA